MGKQAIVKFGLALAMVGGGHYYLNKSAADTYQLQEADKPVYASCKRGFSANDIEPKAASVSVHDACACMAKYASAEVDANKLSAYADAQKALLTLAASSLDNSELSDEEIEDALNPERIMERHKMSDTDYLELTMAAMMHQSTCIVEEAHEGERLAEIAAMRPKSTPIPEVSYREAGVETASTDVLAGLRR